MSMTPACRSPQFRPVLVLTEEAQARNPRPHPGRTQAARGRERSGIDGKRREGKPEVGGHVRPLPQVRESSLDGLILACARTRDPLGQLKSGRALRSTTGDKTIAHCATPDDASDQSATSHRERGEHEPAACATQLGIGRGSIVRLSLRQTPDLRCHRGLLSRDLGWRLSVPPVHCLSLIHI